LNAAAEKLGIDRVEIRRRNLPEPGQTFIPNDTPADGEWKSSLTQAAAAIDWDTPLPPFRGRGVSIGMKCSSTASASFSLVRLHFDGSATVVTGTSDMGQGARTVFSQIAGQELGIPTDRIAMVMGDTAVVPFDTSTSASRSTVFMGNSVIKACRHIKSQLRTAAAAAFRIPEESVEVGNGVVRLPDRELSFVEVLKAYYGPPRGEFIGIGEERSPHVPGHPLGGSPAFWEVMVASAEVDVDVETGMVTIRRVVLVSDVGKALNPNRRRAGQGAAVMGVGHTSWST
jgi:CO/xanthine dehydrogenase Mo-binding subunit